MIRKNLNHHYINIITVAEDFLLKSEKPRLYRIVINHVVSKLKIDVNIGYCFGNIHFALSSDRRFVNICEKKKQMWGLRTWYSVKELKLIDNKNIIHQPSSGAEDDDYDLQAGNNAIDIVENDPNSDNGKQQQNVTQIDAVDDM